MSCKALDTVETFSKAPTPESKDGEASSVPWSQVKIMVTSVAERCRMGVSTKARLE
jgi:hypothetical protein